MLFTTWLPAPYAISICVCSGTSCMEEYIGVWCVQLGLFTRYISCNVDFVYAFCLTAMELPMVSILWVSNAGLHFGSADHMRIGYCFPPLPASPFLLLFVKCWWECQWILILSNRGLHFGNFNCSTRLLPQWISIVFATQACI